jgi:hypothetical protein
MLRRWGLACCPGLGRGGLDLGEADWAWMGLRRGLGFGSGGDADTTPTRRRHGTDVPSTWLGHGPDSAADGVS